MLYSLLQLHLTSPASQAPRLPTPPAPWQSVCHFDRDNSKRSRDISAESKASHRTNIAETTTDTTNTTSHHVKQSRRRPGDSVPVGMLLHTLLHSISVCDGRWETSRATNHHLPPPPRAAGGAAAASMVIRPPAAPRATAADLRAATRAWTSPSPARWPHTACGAT